MTMKLYGCRLLAAAKAFLIRSAILQPANCCLTFLLADEGLYFFGPRLVNGKTWVRARYLIFNLIDQGATILLKIQDDGLSSN